MRKLAIHLVAGLCLIGFAANAAEMTGWISDSTCGAGNASSSESARDCAERCIKEGAAPVFVSEADQKVYKISDPEKAKKHVKGKVKVSGNVEGDVLTITEIEDVKS